MRVEEQYGVRLMLATADVIASDVSCITPVTTNNSDIMASPLSNHQRILVKLPTRKWRPRGAESKRPLSSAVESVFKGRSELTFPGDAKIEPSDILGECEYDIQEIMLTDNFTVSPYCPFCPSSTTN